MEQTQTGLGDMHLLTRGGGRGFRLQAPTGAPPADQENRADVNEPCVVGPASRLQDFGKLSELLAPIEEAGLQGSVGHLSHTGTLRRVESMGSFWTRRR